MNDLKNELQQQLTKLDKINNLLRGVLQLSSASAVTLRAERNEIEDKVIELCAAIEAAAAPAVQEEITDEQRKSVRWAIEQCRRNSAAGATNTFLHSWIEFEMSLEHMLRICEELEEVKEIVEGNVMFVQVQVWSEFPLEIQGEIVRTLAHELSHGSRGVSIGILKNELMFSADNEEIEAGVTDLMRMGVVELEKLDEVELIVLQKEKVSDEWLAV